MEYIENEQELGVTSDANYFPERKEIWRIVVNERLWEPEELLITDKRRLTYTYVENSQDSELRTSDANYFKSWAWEKESWRTWIALFLRNAASFYGLGDLKTDSARASEAVRFSFKRKQPPCTPSPNGFKLP